MHLARSGLVVPDGDPPLSGRGQAPDAGHEDKQYPIVERATLWVRVDDQVPLKPVE